MAVLCNTKKNNKLKTTKNQDWALLEKVQTLEVNLINQNKVKKTKIVE
jgi:hypothetical protein